MTMFPCLQNRYHDDADGHLHPMTWGDLIMDLGCQVGAAACSVGGLAYMLYVVIL